MATIDLSVMDSRAANGLSTQRCDWVSGKVLPQHRILVNGATTLNTFFRTVKSRLGRGNRIGTLTILCHGFAVKAFQDEKKARFLKYHGGFGIEFCKETVKLANAGVFRALRGLFASRTAGIRLVGCAAGAEEVVKIVPSGREKKRSFGKRMCWKIAASAGTGVVASTDIQSIDLNRLYIRIRRGAIIKDVSKGTCVDPGRWEGRVWEFTPSRKVKRFKP